MASDTTSSSSAPDDGAGRSETEIEALRLQIAELLAELKPGLQSQLRERSGELQRLGGELAEREELARRLKLDLEALQARSAELEDEVRRWKDVARRGVDEIAEKARLAAERFERETDELTRALAETRAQLEASRAQGRSLAQARDAALGEVKRRNARVRTLRARIIRREVRRIEMMNSLSWRLTAPIRWAPKALHRMLLGGARLRRKILGK
jgi:chromosome segregation ATPase